MLIKKAQGFYSPRYRRRVFNSVPNLILLMQITKLVSATVEKCLYTKRLIVDSGDFINSGRMKSSANRNNRRTIAMPRRRLSGGVSAPTMNSQQYTTQPFFPCKRDLAGQFLFRL